jgi:hypothetical protein
VSKKTPKTLPAVGPPKIRQPRVLAIDPGNTESGWVYASIGKNALGGLVVREANGAEDNWQLMKRMKEFDPADTRLVIETLKPRGMPTAAEEMETLFWIGMFVRQWIALGGRWTFTFRSDVKLHVCDSAQAKDANVVAALKDRFGGESVAVGGKKCERCHGKKTYGKTLVVCSGCRGEKVVPGQKMGTTKKCPSCSGKGEKQGAAATCDKCRGSGWKHPPGPLANVSTHAWQALGLAVLWADKPIVQTRIVTKIRNNKK